MQVENLIRRADGSEVKIVATLMTGQGLHPSLDNYVLKRKSASDNWVLQTQGYVQEGLVSLAEMLKTNLALLEQAGLNTTQQR